MGIFSSKKKTYVGTSVVRVLEDDQIPDTLKQSLIRSVLFADGDRSVMSNLLEDLVNGPALNFERYYQQAASGDYYFGLPNAQSQHKKAGLGVIQTTLDTLEGEPVTIDYVEFAPINPIHVGWAHVTTDLGYDHASNEITDLSAQKGYPVYLADLVPIYAAADHTELEAGETYNFSDNPRAGFTPHRKGQVNRSMGEYRLEGDVVYDPDSPLGVKVVYCWEDDNDLVHYEDSLLDLSWVEPEVEYYQAKYTLADGTVKYWTYRDNAGAYPAVDAIHAVDYAAPGTYFPFVLFRRNREDRTREAVRDSEEFQSTERLLNALGMDFTAMGAAIHENPDIADVEQAAMIMAVPINTTDPLERRYLFDFFHRLYEQVPKDDVPLASPGRAVTPDNEAVQGSNAVTWTDADFKMNLSFGPIKRTLIRSVSGPIGTVTSTSNSYEVSWRTQTGEVGKNDRPVYASSSYTVTEWSFTKQITETLAQRITVVNPIMRYDIYDDRYAFIGDYDEGALVIPVDRDLVRNYLLVEREKLYFRSLRFVFNSRVTVKVKWYQTGFFKFVLVVAAIVVTYFSGGTFASLISTAMTYGAALTAAVILTYLVATAIKVYAFRVLAKEIGVENTLIAAVVFVALAQMSAFNVGPGYLPTANTMLSVVNGLGQGVQYETQRRLQQYDGEMNAFRLLADEKTEELNNALTLLEVDNTLDPFAFIGREPQTVLGEAPDDYFTRSVHLGNSGPLVFNSVESFVDISLTLPTINSTI